MTVLVGQAPSKETEGALPFSGRCGPKLAGLLGVQHEDLWSKFEVVNVLDHFPGSAGRGDSFPISEARERAKVLAPGFEGRRVVLLGRNVARAFDLGAMPFFEWQAVDAHGARMLCSVVPHPSGMVHFWNEPENVARAKRFMGSIPR
jgi:hypothetical protein